MQMNPRHFAITFYAAIAGLIILFTGCIKNDLPYPYREGLITDFDVEGSLAGTLSLKSEGRTVTIDVCDTVDLRSLRITRLQLSEDTRFTIDSSLLINPNKFPNGSEGFASLDDLPRAADTRINALRPFFIQLDTYQSYRWKVTVNQIFDRKLTVQGQVGEPIIDPMNHTALVYVSEGTDLSNITIQELRLESSISTTAPDFHTVHNFTRPQVFLVTTFGRTEKWTVSILTSAVNVTTGTAEPWATFATLRGGKQEGSTATPGFQYKQTGSTEWITVTDGVVSEATTFSVRLTGLLPQTSYTYRAMLGDEYGSESSFTTASAELPPNLDFEQWSQSGKTWFPNADASNSYWATGNRGVTMSPVNKDSNTSPVEGEGNAIKGKAAHLQSISVPFVKFAAGNLYIGEFAEKVDISNPTANVTFGRSYTGKPTRLTGYYKYRSAPIDTNKDKVPSGTVNDMCHIYVRLWDSSGEEIAYGELADDRIMDSYESFTINIAYSNPAATPARMTIVATSSRWGDLFAGGLGSELWVDEFVLGFDPID